MKKILSVFVFISAFASPVFAKNALKSRIVNLDICKKSDQYQQGDSTFNECDIKLSLGKSIAYQRSTDREELAVLNKDGLPYYMPLEVKNSSSKVHNKVEVLSSSIFNIDRALIYKLSYKNYSDQKENYRIVTVRFDNLIEKRNRTCIVSLIEPHEGAETEDQIKYIARKIVSSKNFKDIPCVFLEDLN